MGTGAKLALDTMGYLMQTLLTPSSVVLPSEERRWLWIEYSRATTEIR